MHIVAALNALSIMMSVAAVTNSTPTNSAIVYRRS
jgi:hypothetical protein